MKKGLVCGIVVLFLGAGVMPMVGSLSVEKYPSVISSVKELKNGPKGFNITLTGTMGDNGWYVSSVTWSITADNGSEAMHVYYKLHDSDPWTECTSPPPLVYQDGYYSLSVIVIDQYGNQWNLGPVPFKIDKTPPVVTQFTEKRVGFFKWKFTADVSDGTSGINRVEFYIDCTLIKTDTAPPYDAFWTGFMFIIRFKWMHNGDTEILPNCIPYDNAGNFPESPNSGK